MEAHTEYIRNYRVVINFQLERWSDAGRIAANVEEYDEDGDDDDDEKLEKRTEESGAFYINLTGYPQSDKIPYPWHLYKKTDDIKVNSWQKGIEGAN